MNRFTQIISCLLVAALFFSGCSQSGSSDAPNAVSNATEIQWMSFEDVQKKMKKKPKKIFVDVYTYWCGPCKKMNAQTFTHPGIVQYINTNYYPVKFNAQEENDILFNGNNYGNPNFDPNKGQYRRNAVHQLSTAMQVSAYPTLVFMDEDLRKIQGIPGYKTPQQLEPILNYFASDNYKSTAWDQFIQGFESRL